MREVQKVLDIHTDATDPHYMALLKEKVKSGLGAMATQAKVDETQLRIQTISQLPDLVRIIHEEEAKIAKLRASS